MFLKSCVCEMICLWNDMFVKWYVCEMICLRNDMFVKWLFVNSVFVKWFKFKLSVKWFVCEMICLWSHMFVKWAFVKWYTPISFMSNIHSSSTCIWLCQGWLKSAILGGSSYKDLGLSLGGVAIRKIIRVPKRPETGFSGCGH